MSLPRTNSRLAGALIKVTRPKARAERLITSSRTGKKGLGSLYRLVVLSRMRNTRNVSWLVFSLRAQFMSLHLSTERIRTIGLKINVTKGTRHACISLPAPEPGLARFHRERICRRSGRGV